MTVASPQQSTINLAKFVACREALVTVAYPDGTFADGSPRLSYAFGSLAKDGDKITIEQAFPLLQADLKERAAILNRKLTVLLPQEQFDAFLSLYYQSGNKALHPVGDLFNASEWELAIAKFRDFDKNSKGVFSKGLLRRRLKEIGLAEGGNYGDISRFPFFDGDPHKVPRQMMPFPEGL